MSDRPHLKFIGDFGLGLESGNLQQVVRLPGFDSLAFRGTLSFDPFHGKDVLGRCLMRPGYFSGK